MKLLGIDARLINQTGVGVYIRNLLFNVEKITPSSWQIYIYLRKKELKTINFKNKNFIKRETDFGWHGFGEQSGFLHILNHDNLDLMHFTYFSYPVLYKRPFITTIHDLTHLIYKSGKASTKNPMIYELKHFILSKMLQAQVSNAKAIITPTNFVRQQIIENFGKERADIIFPIYEGLNEQYKEIKQNEVLTGKFKEPFFIYVGNFYPHKNVERLIKAFSETRTSCRLILVGPDDFFSSRISKLIMELNQDKRIILFKNPNLSDLVFFYKNALALINPSLSEGFGLTNTEAAYFDCPIIASNIKVFREVLGDSYLSFNPRSTMDISKKINYFLAKKPKFDYKGINSKYSFSKMAKETLKLYKKHI